MEGHGGAWRGMEGGHARAGVCAVRLCVPCQRGAGLVNSRALLMASWMVATRVLELDMASHIVQPVRLGAFHNPGL